MELQTGRGVCGYKLQIINASVNTPLTVTVLRNNALGLAASAVAAVATLALF